MVISMKIRPHHLFCMLLYNGNGYSNDFCTGMSKVIENLGIDTDLEIRIAMDDICTACPNNACNECGLGDSGIKERDKNVLDILTLNVGVHNYYDTLECMKKALSPQLFMKICGSCRWYVQGYCTYEMLIERLEYRIKSNRTANL